MLARCCMQLGQYHNAVIQGSNGSRLRPALVDEQPAVSAGQGKFEASTSKLALQWCKQA